MKTKSTRITSPKGSAVYPWLNEPDRRFDQTGVYSVSLRVKADDKDVVTFVDMIKKIADEMYAQVIKETKKKAKKADLPIKDVIDVDGNETGEIDIKFKLKSQGGQGEKTWVQRPALFDSKGKPMNDKVGGGSTIKVGCEAVPFFSPTVGVGVTLRLKAVQILELQEFNGGASSASWFTSEQGFETSGKAAEEVAAENVEASTAFQGDTDF